MRTTTRRDFLKASGLALASGSLLDVLGCAARSTAPAAAGSELAAYDGVGLAELVRKGEVTPRELVEDTLDRIARVNPELNAVLPSLFDPEIALAHADEPAGDGPLAGVPVLLKNMIGYDEARMDYGSRLMARALSLGRSPPRPSSALVEAMQRSGMIVTGVTNAPEFGLIDTTEPILHGPTRNPWNPERSTGGSSGGSAAAVAAGIVPIAHANDGGGSIRIPAAHCGVFGLKPTRGREIGSGRVAELGTLNIVSELCVSRTVRDSAAFLSTVEQRDDPDLAPLGMVQRAASPRPLRIAVVSTGLAGQMPHAEVALAIRRAADLCHELGHDVRETTLPIDGPAFSDAFTGFWATSAYANVQLVEALLGPDTDPFDVLEPWTLGLAEIARIRGPQACRQRAAEVFTRVSEQLEAMFRSYDVVLSPVESVPPFPLGDHDPMGDFDTVFERVFNDCAYTPLNNATGMPGMSVPLHWTDDGLPVGVHFSAWRGREARLLELAYELEEARPWAGRRPRVSAI